MPYFSLYDPALYQQRFTPHTVYYYDRVWGEYHMETHAHAR